jgi:RNA polymerase sigma-70 factor (ECF subfamily)
MANDGELRLLVEARGGSARAFALLVDASQQSVRGFLRRLSGDHALADDLAQEAFSLAWTRIARFEGRSSFRSWVCGIGYRRYLEARRADRRRRDRETAWAAEQDMTTKPADLAIGPLRAALAALPDDQRAAVALCLAGEWTHAEAAAALGLPLGTVKSHVQRGRTRLRTAAGLTDD